MLGTVRRVSPFPISHEAAATVLGNVNGLQVPRERLDLD